MLSMRWFFSVCHFACPNNFLMRSFPLYSASIKSVKTLTFFNSATSWLSFSMVLKVSYSSEALAVSGFLSFIRSFFSKLLFAFTVVSIVWVWLKEESLRLWRTVMVKLFQWADLLSSAVTLRFESCCYIMLTLVAAGLMVEPIYKELVL